jgi:hypothetical protein
MDTAPISFSCISPTVRALKLLSLDEAVSIEIFALLAQAGRIALEFELLGSRALHVKEWLERSWYLSSNDFPTRQDYAASTWKIHDDAS